jgi:hypothetical protein
MWKEETVIYSGARFEVLTAMKILVEILQAVTPCSVLVGYQRFGGPLCLHLQGEVKIEAIRSSEALVSCSSITRSQNPEDLDFSLM